MTRVPGPLSKRAERLVDQCAEVEHVREERYVLMLVKYKLGLRRAKPSHVEAYDEEDKAQPWSTVTIHALERQAEVIAKLVVAGGAPGANEHYRRRVLAQGG